jgi:hypothetical protein
MRVVCLNLWQDRNGAVESLIMVGVSGMNAGR